MTRITRISRLRSCGIFRDFAWPAELPEFGRYNLVYGWNGTGKTTLSRIFRCLENGTPPSGEVAVQVESRRVQGDQFPNETLPIRVFNREFIADNVFPVGGGELVPIFVLGAESVEKQKEIERLKSDRARAQSELESARAAKQQAEKQLDQFCIDRAKVIKETLRSSGPNRYNNYNKADFQDDARTMDASGSRHTHLLGDADRDSLVAKHQDAPKPKVQVLTYALPDFDAIGQRVSNLLTTTVVSAGIETLKGDPTVAEWVREGLGLHRDLEAERCLFCEQPLPKERLAALDGHFSAQYEQLLESVDGLVDELHTSIKMATELRLPNKAELYHDLEAEFEAAKTILVDALDEARQFLESAVQALRGKKRRPFEQIAVDLRPPIVDAKSVDKLIAVLRRHNQACDDFRTRIDSARERLALGMIAEALEDFARLRAGAQQAVRDVGAKSRRVQHLDAEIARLDREIIDHLRSAEELNEDLRKYLGHDELCLDVNETGYTISRHGVLAQSLSEGEMTAIAILYFLKTLQDRDFDPSKGIVVLDDPVSSLDANALFLAFGFIRERTKDVGQLLILTHNFSFFREVRNWFQYLNKRKKKASSERPARFFMLDCAHGQGGRYAAIRGLDPLLEKYESEYHYLFSQVYRASTREGTSGLEQNYALPNMARRMLESFLAFRHPQFSRQLWQALQEVIFDEARKLRIYQFVNAHSHSCGVGEPAHDPSVLAEGPAVLRDLLALIGSEDPKHFEAMVQLVASPTQTLDGGGEAATP